MAFSALRLDDTRSRPPPAVIHVLGGLDYGGTEQLCLRLAQHAPAKLRHLVVGLDSSRDAMKAVFAALPDVEVVCGPGRARGEMLRWLTQLFRAQRPRGVIVYAFGVPHLIAGIAARLAGVPRIAVSAGNPPPRGNGRWKWQVIVALSRVLGIPIQSCSAAVEHELLDLGVGLPRGSTIIPNACDVEAIAQTAASARHALSGERPLVVGMVARLDAIKGHAMLLRGFAQALRREPDLNADLWLVGDGELSAALRAQASELGLNERVRFWGAREDVAELLGRMDVYAFCTTAAEGFGVALIEAMAAGLPVVASDVPACREVLAGGAAGMLVPPADPPALADALLALLRAPQLREQWGLRGQQHARSHYDVGAFSRRWYGALGIAPEGGARVA